MSGRRVYLHVGTPKSGTSYLQDKLALNRDELERQGLDYVRTRSGDHFEAALDLIGERWAGEEKAARGQWDALAQGPARGAATCWSATRSSLRRGPESVRRAMESFPQHEVHVVVTARDLGRQIPAEWQERVKHRGGRDYMTFLKALMRSYGPRTTRCGSGGCSTCPGSSPPGAPTCRRSTCTWSRCRLQEDRVMRCGTGSRA